MLWILAAVEAAKGLDLTPIIVAVVAALGGSGLTAMMTLRRTNKKLEAESEKLYQEALNLAEDRAAKNIETMERMTNSLSERLTATEAALGVAHARIGELEARGDLLAVERDKALSRLRELEEKYADLIALLPGRRRTDVPKS